MGDTDQLVDVPVSSLQCPLQDRTLQMPLDLCFSDWPGLRPLAAQLMDGTTDDQ